MAQEYKLSFSAEEIDNRLNLAGNAILYTEQNLTEEQKAQARANIGAISKDEENIVIEEVEYTYDGNTNDEDDVWVYNYSKTAKVFYKAGDIPENGKINLVGGHVSVTVPVDTWWDYSFEITEEMLGASVDYDGWIIPANVNGLTQILYQNVNTQDNTPIAVVVICTRAGRYNIAFNGWGEELTFAEKGIYLLDNRDFGGSKHVNSFSCTITINSSTDSPEGGQSPIKYNGNEIQVFNRGICIGDSITEGVFNYSDGEAIIKKYSYPSILNKITGVNIVNAGVAGLTSQTWYAASLNSDTQYGKWVNNEWVWNMAPDATDSDIVSTLLDYSGFDFAIIHLGINDIGMMGSLTIDEVVTNFETNINNIISKLKISNNGIKIFLATIIPCYAEVGNSAYETLNNKIREIANASENVFLIDLNEYSECAKGTPYENQHLTAIGYHKMASEISSLISYTISQNLDDFKSVQFIGTSYTII